MTAKTDWTNPELLAAVEAYLWMLDRETCGAAYNKTAVSQALRDGALTSRTKASIEYRMRNISATLEEHCLPRINRNPGS